MIAISGALGSPATGFGASHHAAALFNLKGG